MRIFPPRSLPPIAFALAVSPALLAQSAPFAQYTGAAASSATLSVGRGAQQQSPQAPLAPHSDREQVLPIRSVALYTNGVAFVELAGTVHGDALIRIDLTTSQLNDALASLTAWDLGGGKVTGGGYHAAPSSGDALRNLLPNLGPNPTQADVLRALKGKTVQVRNGKTAVTGRILNVEVHSEASPVPIFRGNQPANYGGIGALPAPSQKTFLSLISDKGSIQSVELTSATEVQVLGPEGLQLTRALHLVDTTPPEPEMRHLTIEDHGTGTRELHISYLTQAPAWKSTYRALFDGKDSTQAKLQGFAVIDNITADDWKNVKLTLVSGAPQSFIQQIARPLTYMRQTVPMPKPGVPMKTPPMPLGVMADPLASAAETASAGHGITQSQSAIAQTVVVGALAKDEDDDTTPLPNGPATTTDLGDLFEFHLSQPVNVARGQSINVPILEASLPAERVTAWSAHHDNRVSMRALYFTNTTGLMLDHGAFTVLIGNAFAGEGELDLTHPSQKQLVRYSTDESIHVTESRTSKDTAPYIHSFEVKDGELTVHRRAPEARDFKITNTSGSTTKVILQLQGQDRYHLDAASTRPVERLDNIYRFEVTSNPGETPVVHFVEFHTHPNRYKFIHISEDEMKTILREANNDPALTALLQPFLDTRHQLADLDRRLQRNVESQKSAEAEEARIRSNMAALPTKGDNTLSRRYSDEMAAQEDKLSTLHTEREQIIEKHHELEDDLNTRAANAPAANTVVGA